MKVTVDSAAPLIGADRLVAASTVQPAGTVSATVPAGERPRAGLHVHVAWNDWPPTLKKRSKVMFSSVPTGSPPGSATTAP